MEFNPKIIEEVREHRLRIKATFGEIQGIKAKAANLNNILIQQDMDNAIKLLSRKAERLRDRIKYTKELC